MPFVPLNFNPYLTPWLTSRPSKIGGQDNIEYPGKGENFTWQTRKAEPTPYENDFADALEKVLEAGALELEEMAAGLTRIGFSRPDGVAWTAVNLADELHARAEL